VLHHLWTLIWLKSREEVLLQKPHSNLIPDLHTGHDSWLKRVQTVSHQKYNDVIGEFAAARLARKGHDLKSSMHSTFL
jgi:hypothetical protein